MKSVLQKVNSYMKTLRFRRPWEKVLCSIIVAMALAIFTSREFDTFLDTSVMVFVYCCWIFFSLPSIYRKLTVKLLSDFTTVFIQFFIADVAIFVIYNILKRYTTGKEAVYDSVEQRGYVFLMNFIRVSIVAYCALGSCTKFWKTLRGPQRKSERQQGKKRL